MRTSRVIRFMAACSIFFRLVPCSGDSWFPPSEFQTLSGNKKFVARVTPATTNTRPLLVVSQIEGGRTNLAWKTELGNKVSPLLVFVSDNGASVVTFDNWGQPDGYGDDVRNKNQQRGNFVSEFCFPG